MTMVNNLNSKLIRPKRCSTFRTTFINLVIIIFVVNYTTCLEALSIAEYVKLKEEKFEKRATVSDKICDTRACSESASNILNHMDLSIKPCDDFYRFACGNFIKKEVIPNDKPKIDVFTRINDKLQEQLRTSIQNSITEKDPKAFQLLQTYYKTCLNTEQIEKYSYNEFREILTKLNGWPVLEGNLWNESKFDWQKIIFKLRNLGYPFNYFINFLIDIDGKDNNNWIINFDQAALGISQRYLSKGLEDKIVQDYLKLMINVAILLGAKPEQSKKELAEALNFEIELAKISDSNEQRRDVIAIYNPMTVSDLEKKYPGIGWLNYSNNILAPNNHIDGNERIIVVAPNFFEKLQSLIQKTPKRVLANYIIWRVTYDSISVLGRDIRNAMSEFEFSFMGTSQTQPRWQECITQSSASFFVAVGALYVRRYFDKNSKSDTVEIMESIRRSFKSILIQVNWMDTKTKEAALKKLESIVPHVGYPIEFFDNKKLDEYYQTLKINNESLLKNHLNLNLFHLANKFNRLKKPANKTDWIIHGRSANVNAYYDFSENSIQFPAGILQQEFFRKDRPKYMNYGAIGYIMGHEITHGFDDEGRQYDKNGNLIEWWELETKKNYLERAQCIIDQYSNYTVKQLGLKLNGVNTQGENIADNGGIKQAYYAYNDWERRNGQEPRLPGLNYTSQQMFWISAANIWCNNYRPEALKARILVDVHSPAEFRVLGPFSNMPEFSKDFKCPLGSIMNPEKKCMVW